MQSEDTELATFLDELIDKLSQDIDLERNVAQNHVVNLVKLPTGVFVFGIDDIRKLRNDYRIVGMLCGPIQCLSSHSRVAPPLQLRQEEVRLLLEKKYARLVIPSESNNIAKSEKLRALETFQRRLHDFSNIERFREKLEFLCLPRLGLKRLRKEPISPKSVEYKPSVFNTNDPINVQLVNTPFQCFDEIEPSFDDSNPMENLKFKIFSDLWEQGNMITGGSNFASDYLIYKGDPSQHHAHACVFCIIPNSTLNVNDIMRYCRVGSSIKKKIILASMENGKIKYITLTWEA